MESEDFRTEDIPKASPRRGVMRPGFRGVRMMAPHRQGLRRDTNTFPPEPATIGTSAIGWRGGATERRYKEIFSPTHPQPGGQALELLAERQQSSRTDDGWNSRLTHDSWAIPVCESYWTRVEGPSTRGVLDGV